MKKLLSLFAGTLFAFNVYATETWTAPAASTGFASYVRVAQAVSTTGSENANQLNATSGILLKDLGAVTVYLKVTSGTTTAGKLLAYTLNPANGEWYPMPDLDLIVPAGVTTSYSWPGWVISAPLGRLAYVPSGIGVATTVHVDGYTSRR